MYDNRSEYEVMFGPSSLYSAVSHHDLHRARALYYRGHPKQIDCVMNAIRNEDIDMLDLLNPSFETRLTFAMQYAVQANSYKALRYLFNHIHYEIKPDDDGYTLNVDFMAVINECISWNRIKIAEFIFELIPKYDNDFEVDIKNSMWDKNIPALISADFLTVIQSKNADVVKLNHKRHDDLLLSLNVYVLPELSNIIVGYIGYSKN
jgi:hypothetical protein